MKSENSHLSLADRRSAALHAEVAGRLNEDRELVLKALGRVTAWLLEPGSHPYASAWKDLLDGDLAELKAALVSPHEAMCTLRSASPFAGALDSRTRWRILKQPELRSRETSQS